MAYGACWQNNGKIPLKMLGNNSVEIFKNYELYDDGPQAFGSRNKQAGMRPDGSKVKDESALFDEYREGLRIYNRSKAHGSYKLNISKDRVSVDFHGGDSKEVTKTFILR